MSAPAPMGGGFAAHYARTLPLCRAAVDEAIRRYEEPPACAALLGLPPGEYDPARIEEAFFAPLRAYLARGGKLLRPYVVSLVLEAYGRDPSDHPVSVALAEIIHSASLMLDDVADDSVLRRGGPSAHQMLGVAVATGAGTAWVNASAWLLWKDRERLGHGTAGRLLDRINRAHMTTGFGQVIDVGWAGFDPPHPKASQYLQGVVHRNAYTFRLPFEIGGIATGAAEDEVERLGAFGELLGVAYQVVDDMLNLRPRDGRWGKVIAEDLTEGKYSIPVLLGLERAAPERRARLHQILRLRTRDRALLEEAISILEESGAFGECTRIAGELTARAKAQLGALHLPEGARACFLELTDFLIQRNI